MDPTTEPTLCEDCGAAIDARRGRRPCFHARLTTLYANSAQGWHWCERCGAVRDFCVVSGKPEIGAWQLPRSGR